MLKTGLGLILAVLLAASAFAQKPDTLKADTSLLNKYRIDPGKNPLPVRQRPVQISEQLIPVELLDYKVSYWRKSMIFGLNFNQAAFTNNWSAGGVSAVALGSNFDFKAEYNKSPLNYTTETNLLYGIAATKGQGSRKTNDRIFLDNKIATQISKKWYFFGSLSFESQFAAGYTYTDLSGNPVPQGLIISNFMAPGYLTESVGFEYKPNKFYDLRIGTGTAKQTFLLDTNIYKNLPQNYGVKPGHTFYNQLAVQGVGTVDKDIAKNLHLTARYAVFIPYVQPLAYITHRIDATLTAKVNRLVNVSMNGTFLYDKNTAKAPQATEGISMGVAYTFP
ncbi:MAG: DUF3078 domain-containing protein [Bacteroidetes bacterium]|nr:DUF3078 domain-containing protein [Bacteroidota bacterium]